MRHPFTSQTIRRFRNLSFAVALGLVSLGVATSAAAQQRTGRFSGPKVNAGTVTSTISGNGIVLTLSDDFQVPDTPAPHWQVVDSRGNAYLLQRLKVKGLLADKLNKTIVVPAYVPDVAKVQIWCAWAEVLLGEASFAAPVHH